MVIELSREKKVLTEVLFWYRYNFNGTGIKRYPALLQNNALLCTRLCGWEATMSVVLSDVLWIDIKNQTAVKPA